MCVWLKVQMTARSRLTSVFVEVRRGYSFSNRIECLQQNQQNHWQQCVTSWFAGELEGGGPFHGSINDGAVAFTTRLPTSQMVIEWRAELSENKMSGTYSVTSDNSQMIAEGLGHQEGVWSCLFVRGPGNVDLEKSDLVWMFDDGEAEGPIAKAELIKTLHLGAGPTKQLSRWKTAPCG
jgi:hypothetical protein